MGIAPFRDASRISRRREPPSRPTRPGLVRGLWRGLIGVLILGQLTLVQAGQLTSHLFTAKDYQGSRDRQYQVYVPEGLSGAAPLVMVLHGCAQTPEEVLRDWGMTAAADRHGFILVAPFVTSWDGLRGTNCWGFWLKQHQQAGRGEPEDLYRIAREVEQTHAIDPQRRYITGLSSGGAMTAVLAVTHNHYWAAAAPAAGLAYGEEATAVSMAGTCPGWAIFHEPARVVSDMRAQLGATAYPMPLLVLHNDWDCRVPQPAGHILRDAQLALYGKPGHRTAETTAALQTDCTPVFQADHGCRHTRYTHDARPESPSLVETIFYAGPPVTPDPSDHDLGHYWIGGEDGRDGPYAVRQGPSYPEIIWAFFARHPRDGGTLSLAEQPATCARETASPWAHLSAGRGLSAHWGTTVISSGDRKTIGRPWIWWSRISLYQGPADLWFLERPAVCLDE